MAPPDKPTSPVIRAWVAQLLELADVLERFEGRQVEVRLRTSKGRVPMRPTVILDGGPQEMQAPSGE